LLVRLWGFLDTQGEWRGSYDTKNEHDETAYQEEELLKAFLARNFNTERPNIKRANEYATPRHNAITTNAYSVSLPV